MTVPTPRRHALAGRAELLSNWLALLALLALGIVWPGADAARLPRTSHALACAPPVAHTAPDAVAVLGTP